jgi:hypothetical protein
MEVKFKILMNEIEPCSELSYYNHVVWKFKYKQETGFTHFVEVYNDVSYSPIYDFGVIEEQSDGDIGFTACLSGEGEGIDKEDIGWGGRYVMVHIFWNKDLVERK